MMTRSFAKQRLCKLVFVTTGTHATKKMETVFSVLSELSHIEMIKAEAFRRFIRIYSLFESEKEYSLGQTAEYVC
jgi:hypothetical protein